VKLTICARKVGLLNVIFRFLSGWSKGAKTNARNYFAAAEIAYCQNGLANSKIIATTKQ